MKPIVVLAFTLLVLNGCGGSNGSVDISSDGFSASGTADALVNEASSLSAAPLTPVTDFKVCVRSVRLEDENDEVRGAEDQAGMAFNPGLIDLTSGEPKEWGRMEMPVGFKLKRIKVKVQKNAELCGVDYSIKFNTETEQRDVEFRFRFEPPVEVEANDKLKLALSGVVMVLRNAADSGDFNRIKEHVESIDGIASK